MAVFLSVCPLMYIIRNPPFSSYFFRSKYIKRDRPQTSPIDTCLQCIDYIVDGLGRLSRSADLEQKTKILLFFSMAVRRDYY
jgi:hypothetical protein